MSKKKSPVIAKKPDIRVLAQPYIQSALEALHKKNFAAYIVYLDNLGRLLNKFYQKTSQASQLPSDKKIFKQQRKKWVEQILSETKYSCSDRTKLAYCVFEEAWIDEHLRKPIVLDNKENYRRYLSPKGNLNRSSRTYINLGMQAVALCIQPQRLQLSVSEQTLRQRDKKACLAIKSFKTKKQKILDANGKALAIAMTIVCSIVTAGAVALAVAAWPIALAGAITLIVFAASLVINWFSFRTIVPRMLNDIFGKDKFCEGLTTYRDQQTGEKLKLTLGKRIALGISSCVAALVGGATGAVTYGFILGLGKLAILPFLAAGTIGAACLPPLGILISIVFCFSSIVLMLKPIINIIRAKNFKSMLLQPFKHTAALFDPNNKKNVNKSLTRLKAEKIITYTILGMLSAFTLIGLVILQIQNGAALQQFLSQTLAISSAIAVGVSYTISMISVLIGQLPYALATLSEGLIAVVAGYRNLISHSRFSKGNKRHKPNSSVPVKNTVLEGIKDTIDVLNPNKAIEKEATRIRLKILKNVTCKDSLAKKKDALKTSYLANKEKGVRERYYQLYFFAKPQNQPIQSSFNTKKTNQYRLRKIN